METSILQVGVNAWMLRCFGAEVAADAVERNFRFLEESLELVQSLGCTQGEAHELVDYVFGRKTGKPEQELGGVGITLAALCNAHQLDMDEHFQDELRRICRPEVMAKIQSKQAAKPRNVRMPLPGDPT